MVRYRGVTSSRLPGRISPRTMCAAVAGFFAAHSGALTPRPMRHAVNLEYRVANRDRGLGRDSARTAAWQRGSRCFDSRPLLCNSENGKSVSSTGKSASGKRCILDRLVAIMEECPFSRERRRHPESIVTATPSVAGNTIAFWGTDAWRKIPSRSTNTLCRKRTIGHTPEVKASIQPLMETRL
jgi:hypothetical protein